MSTQYCGCDAEADHICARHNAETTGSWPLSEDRERRIQAERTLGPGGSALLGNTLRIDAPTVSAIGDECNCPACAPAQPNPPLKELLAKDPPWFDVPAHYNSAMQSFDTGAKPSNPKDIVGSDKLPLHLWPETATAMGAVALLDGALKYGRTNWRVIGVKASIYNDAVRRHLNKWFEGEDTDPDSGLPHLAHALACIAIMVDARAAGLLTDDRMVAGGYVELLADLTPHVRRLKEKYEPRHPKHYTIQDTPETLGEEPGLSDS